MKKRKIENQWWASVAVDGEPEGKLWIPVNREPDDEDEEDILELFNGEGRRSRPMRYATRFLDWAAVLLPHAQAGA